MGPARVESVILRGDEKVKLKFSSLKRSNQGSHLPEHEAKINSVHLVISTGVSHFSKMFHHQLKCGQYHRGADLAQHCL